MHKIENSTKLKNARNLKPLWIIKCRKFNYAADVPFYAYPLPRIAESMDAIISLW